MTRKLLKKADLLADGKIDIDRAKAICDIGQVLVNSAKVEVDMMKATDGQGTGFMRNINVKQIGVQNNE